MAKPSRSRRVFRYAAAASVVGATIAFVNGDDLNDIAERPIWTEFQCAANNGGRAEVYTTLLANGLAIKDKDGTPLYTDFHTDGIEQQTATARAFCDTGQLPAAASERRAFWNGDFYCTGRNGEKAVVDSSFSSTRVDMGEYTTSISTMMYNPAIAKARDYCGGGGNPLATGLGLNLE